MITDAAAEVVRRWQKDPISFVREEFKTEPDAWQLEYLTAFADPNKKRIALQACKGPGKTAAIAWTIWNFMSCYGRSGNHPKGAATSITADNLDDNLWPELAKWRDRSEFLKAAFEWKHERIYAKAHPETWFFSKRTWPKSADKQQQANTLAGLHADYVLFVLDESGGIPESVMAAAEGGLSTGRWSKIVQAGNPTHLEGPLYRAATVERHLWHLITITGDPDDAKRSPRISVEWAREQIEKYGATNPWVLVNVFGRFPPSSLNSLLGPDEVNAAMKRQLTEPQYAYSQKRLGIDVARFGDDRTMIFPRQGLVAFTPVEMRNANGPEVAARVAQAKQKWGSEIEFVDDTGGYGGSVIDAMQQANLAPFPVNFSQKADDPRYLNKRAEMWFRMAEWIKKGAVLPNDPELARELTAPTYTFHSGKFKLEEKDQIKTRLGYSPDKADALALTFAIVDMPATHPLIRKEPLAYEYDPYAERTHQNILS